MLVDSPQLITVQTEFEDDVFFDICRVVFGINPEQVEDDSLRRAIFHAICERFIGITMNDIQEAFSRHEPSEKVYVLCRKDFIAPIEKYWNKKNIIKIELKKQLEEIQEANLKHSKVDNFYNESIELYIKCLENREWTGTPFQANSFAKVSFAGRFSQEEKNVIYERAKQEVRTLLRQRDIAIKDGIDSFIPIPNDVQMFSQLVTIEACKRGLFIIKE